MIHDGAAARASAGGGFGTTRIEALADGIFAVAMTLLVLDVKIPDGLDLAADRAMIERLLSLEHSYAIYFISFIVLGMFWVGHHAHFHFIRYVNHTLLWINLLFLFGITSVPFATDLLGSYSQLRLPYVAYGALLLLLSGLLVCQIAYLRWHSELARPTLTRERARAIVLRTAIFATVPVLSMVAVFYNTRLALYLYFLLLVVHFLPGRVDMPAEPEGGR